MFLTARVCSSFIHNDNKKNLSAWPEEWSSHRESNSGPLPYQGSTLPLSHASRILGKKWSGRRGSNSRLPPWKGGALPTELRPRRQKWWRGIDSNNRRLTPADLQSAPFGHSGTTPRLLTSLWLDSIQMDRTTKSGAAHRNRTCDLRFTKPLLYQLS